MKSGNDRDSNGYPKGLATGKLPALDGRLNAKLCSHLRGPFFHFLAGSMGQTLLAHDRPSCSTSDMDPSLDLSHSQPAKVCGEVIAHRDILATYAFGSCLWPI